MLEFDTDGDEAAAIADLFQEWLAEDIPPHEITVFVRQMPYLIAAPLAQQLIARGIPYRNEQESQDLTAEPAVTLVLNFLRVVADERLPDAYAELIRSCTLGIGYDAEDQTTDSRLRKLLAKARAISRSSGFDRKDFSEWKALVDDFLRFVSRPALNALSPSYQQGTRLNEILNNGGCPGFS